MWGLFSHNLSYSMKMKQVKNLRFRVFEVLVIFAFIVFGVHVAYKREGEVRLEKDTVQTSQDQVVAIEKAFQLLEKKEMEEHWVQCVESLC